MITPATIIPIICGILSLLSKSGAVNIITKTMKNIGTGCVTMINDHLYEGRYTPTNAYGKRESHNIYAKTREECEEKLAEMIVQVKAQIKAEKDKMTG